MGEIVQLGATPRAVTENFLKEVDDYEVMCVVGLHKDGEIRMAHSHGDHLQKVGLLHVGIDQFMAGMMND